MNLNFISKIVLVSFSVMTLISCESHEQKTDEAFEQFKKDKMMSEDESPTTKVNDQKKFENQDVLAKFTIEIGSKILANENTIKEIKNMPGTNANLFKKLTSIEKDNNDLRRQMAEYKEEVKLKWENFKAKMNLDVKEIGIELKDLKTNNKK